jgi:ATP-dependent helicase/nuclease subunit B
VAGADGLACAAHRARGAHPARTLVLVPYAQLMPVATRQWGAAFPDGFAPRFETTRNWARQLAPFRPGPDDLSFDPARDLPLAQSLLERAGLGAQRDVLAAALVESALQLAALAAARAPDERLAWAAGMTPLLAGAETGPLALEAAVARLALVWAATSAQATDVLFSALALETVDAVLVLQGFQPEPLTTALAARWGERAETLALPAEGARGDVRLFPAVDTEDEAERAAARVLAHIEAGRVPVALAATDRALTRRVRALLGARGVAMRDENGWKLSTTRVAAELMALLRALAWNASSDEVLDALKSAPRLGRHLCPPGARTLAAPPGLARLARCRAPVPPRQPGGQSRCAGAAVGRGGRRPRPLRPAPAAGRLARRAAPPAGDHRPGRSDGLGRRWRPPAGRAAAG